MQKYRQKLTECVNNGYEGFKPFLPESESAKAAPPVAQPAEVSA